MNSNENLKRILEEKTILDTFWNEVAGKEKVKTGNLEYIRPLNYKTDEQEVIVDRYLPVLNLKNRNKQEFEKLLIEYVRKFFASEKYWANPISSCNTLKDKLVHCISTLWLNATPEDFENPIQFIQRYINFLQDNTFDELTETVQINRLQTLQNCSLQIRRAEQNEFQETPNAIDLTVKKDNAEKKLPRIAYGISNGIAYIYGIQGTKTPKETDETMKRINRSRFAVNKTINNVPEDYKQLYLKQEPYSYISLFVFLSLIKQKGINRIIMPAYLPERNESKERLIKQEFRRKKRNLKNKNNATAKEKRDLISEFIRNKNDHQRIQYNITNKFLYYMARMECDIKGIEILQTPEENNSSLVIDISKMKVTEDSNIIFYELNKKIQNLMKTKDEKEQER